MTAPDEPIDLQEIINEMDELGRAKFDAALERVKTRKVAEQNDLLRARIAELESQAPTNGAMRGVPGNDGLPRAAAERRKLAEAFEPKGDLDG